MLKLYLAIILITIQLMPLFEQTLTFTVLREDVNSPKFSYPGFLWAIHIGPNFKVKNKLPTLIYS